MADVKVRRLPAWVVASFKSRAQRAGHSLEEELRALLTETASKPRQNRVTEMAAFQRMLEKKYGQLADSAPGIRADRDKRG
jgi:plasmid stability protein